MSTTEETLHFLKILYASSPASYLTLTAIHPDGKHPSPSRHILLSDTKALEKGLIDLQAANRQGWGAYFSVANRRGDLGRWRRGGLTDLAQLPALFVDIDTPMQVMAWGTVEPSCVVASGRGIHAYWFLEHATDNWSLAQLALETLRKEYQSDKTSVVSCLRLPNTLNTKPNRDRAPCRILSLNPQRYPLEVFLSNSPAKTDQTGQTAHSLRSDDIRNNHQPDRFSYARNVSPRQTLRLNPRLVQAVCASLVSSYGGRWKQNGWLAARCPCHHEHDGVGMHFSFHPDKAVGVCLGKHGRMLLKELCQRLQIRPSEYGGLYADR